MQNTVGWEGSHSTFRPCLTSYVLVYENITYPCNNIVHAKKHCSCESHLVIIAEDEHLVFLQQVQVEYLLISFSIPCSLLSLLHDLVMPPWRSTGKNGPTLKPSSQPPIPGGVNSTPLDDAS